MGKLSYFKWQILDGVTSDSTSDFLDICAKKKYTNGYAVYVYLLERMFSHGHYWTVVDEKAARNIMRACFINSPNTLLNIIETAVDSGLFDKDIYDKHGVLTSRMIQEIYQTTMPACHLPFDIAIPELMLVPYDKKQKSWLRARGNSKDSNIDQQSQIADNDLNEQS